MSCLAKLLTNIINNRLIEWSKVYDTITDAQFGFRNGLSTVGAIFALQTLITKSLIGGKKAVLCVCGLYDTVDRLNLWHKLSVIGIQGKLLSIIKSMYSNVRTCVSVDGFYTEFFANNVGLIQGEVISPILFALYVNDCEMDFINHNCDPIQLKELSLFLIMYADDMVIFSETAEGLQKLC